MDHGERRMGPIGEQIVMNLPCNRHSFAFQNERRTLQTMEFYFPLPSLRISLLHLHWHISFSFTNSTAMRHVCTV